MKKIICLFVLGITLIACKKEYTCVCIYDDPVTGEVAEENFATGPMTANNAQKKCQDTQAELSQTYPDVACGF